MKMSLQPRRAARRFFAESPWFFVIVTLLALLVRAAFFPHVSEDYTAFLAPWMEELAQNGGLAAIGRPVGNYFVLYLYLLAGLTHLPLPGLLAIKLLSCAGDIVLAYFCMRTAHKLTQSNATVRAVYAVVLCMPSVVLNSSAWAQCDALYTAALIACLFYVLSDKPWAAMACLGLAGSFKLQAVFFAPLLLVLLVRKHVRVRHLLAIPAVYGAAMLPAVLAGRGFWETATIYLRQAGQYENLCIGAANPYVFLDARPNKEIFATLGIVCYALALCVMLFLVLRQTQPPLCPQTIVLLALLGAFSMAYLLPHMHERYFYPADILSVLYAATCLRRRWFVPVITAGTSALTVTKYLYGGAWINEAVLAVPMFAVLCVLVWDALHRKRMHASPT